MIRNGHQHIDSLRDGRAIYLDGALIDDATSHPAYKNAIASVGRMFDFHSSPENRDLMTFQTETGDRANRIWQLPKSYEELKKRRAGLEAWTALHGGFLGRAPDHVASCISGMYMGLDVFEAYDKERAAKLADYYKYARDNDLYLTYVIINPQADRSKNAAEQQDPFLSAGIVDRDAEGVTIRGAKMLATGGIMANEVFVTCIQPLAPGEERYAISFAIPMNAKGLKILSRNRMRPARSLFSTILCRAASTRMMPSFILMTSRFLGIVSSVLTIARSSPSSFTPHQRMSIRTIRLRSVFP
jgi:4-hydroxyphenylacetate 3-monooxygenase